ncbi:MAG: hypothetical protein QOF37_1005, partial [Thermoleophilaceae bacterium]|nr:hypothetical protein [Thermoleophilaceae bacterium]
MNRWRGGNRGWQWFARRSRLIVISTATMLLAGLAVGSIVGGAFGDGTNMSFRCGPGSGPVGSGPVGSGPVFHGGSGPVGSGPVGSGPVGSGPVGSGPVGSGPVGSGPGPCFCGRRAGSQ